MNNIEKLAIEAGFEVFNGRIGLLGAEKIHDVTAQLEAFAKALQSSEPVAEVVHNENQMHVKILKYKPLHHGTKLFIHPPATVSLEKYNKLLEAYKSAIQSIDDYDCYDRETGKPYFKHEIFKWDLEFISEIEGKNEQSINSN